MNRHDYAQTLARARSAPFPKNLTDREREVIEVLSRVGSRKGVANTLGISVGTVGDYLKACNLKAEVRCSVVLVARYLRATLEVRA